MPLNKHIQIIIILCLVFNLHISVNASKVLFKNTTENFLIEEVISDLGVIWGMAFLSQNELIFSQRNGKIGLFDINKNKLIWINNSPAIYHNGQAGLLDVAVPFDYQQSNWIYFTLRNLSKFY